MQDFYILGLKGLFFLSIPLEVLRQGISSSISFALSIINLEVVPGQLLNLPDLLRTQVFRLYKMLEFIMVCKHENFMLAALQVISLGFEGFNNGQQLAVMGLIPNLCQNHLFGENSYSISSAQIIQGQLTKNSTNSIARSIRLNLDITLQIKII